MNGEEVTELLDDCEILQDRVRACASYGKSHNAGATCARLRSQYVSRCTADITDAQDPSLVALETIEFLDFAGKDAEYPPVEVNVPSEPGQTVNASVWKASDRRPASSGLFSA